MSRYDVGNEWIGDALLWIAAIIVAGALVMGPGCGNAESPVASTGSTQVASKNSGASASDATPTVESTPEPSGLDIIVKDNGVVVNNTGTTYTACLFDAPFGEGKLVEEWKAKPGRTEMTYKNDSCDPSKGQIDLTEAGSCPSVPHGMVIVAANPNVTIPNGIEAGNDGEPIIETWTEWGDWGECQFPTGEVAASTVVQCQRQAKGIEYTKTTQNRLCGEPVVEVTEREVYKSEPCKCPCVDVYDFTVQNTGLLGAWFYVLGPDGEAIWEGWLNSGEMGRVTGYVEGTYTLKRWKVGSDPTYATLSTDICSQQEEPRCFTPLYDAEMWLKCDCRVLID